MQQMGSIVLLLIIYLTVIVCQDFNMVFAAEIQKSGKMGQSIVREIEFKEARVQDAVRVISELTKTNIVATSEAGKKLITIFVRNLAVSDIVDSICRVSGLWYRYNPQTKIFIVMTTEEYQRDIVVYRYEPTRMFQLKYLNVGIAARTISDLFGDRVELKGTANGYQGDDYKIADIVDTFEDKDDGEDDTTENDNDKKEIKELELANLSPSQIALLEAKAKNELQIISEGMIGQVSQRKEAPIYVTINRLHNMLFVRTADEKAMKEIAKIIKNSDQQVPEVLLEMKVLEVQLTDQFESAFDVSNISGNQQTGPDDGQSINPLNPDSDSVGSSLLGLGNSGLQESSSMIFQVLSGNLRMRLQLLEQNNNIKALATPMLLAANNHPARLFIGEETVLTTGFSTSTFKNTSTTGVVINNYIPVPETEVRSIGNTLSILPSINADRSVVMRIVHENSSIKTNGGKIPLLVGDKVEDVSIDTVSTSTLEGTVLAMDGMTVAVGGMMRTSYTDSESKVPVLGDIPLLGFFFKNQQKIEIKTELVLLITPHVLSAPEQGEALSRQRLEELTDHPNGLDVYMDSLDKSRPEARQKKDASLEMNSDILQKSFVEMTKIAVEQVRIPYLLRQPKGIVHPVSLKSLSEVQAFHYNGIVSKPVAAWTNGYHFVTALKVINHTARPQLIDIADLNGTWKSATLEKQMLEPAKENGDFTYLYLISASKFEKTILGRALK